MLFNNHRSGRTARRLLGLVGLVAVVYFIVAHKPFESLTGDALAEDVTDTAHDQDNPHCTAETARVLFESASSCPEQPWLLDYWQTYWDGNNSTGRPFVVFDVGANKGYFTAEVLRKFFPAKYEGISTRIFRTALHMGCHGTDGKENSEAAAVNMSVCCGACHQCVSTESVHDIPSTNDRSVAVHLFEPSPSNFKIISTAYRTLQQLGVTFLHQAALSNASGTGIFPDAKPGWEKGTLDKRNIRKFVRVKLLTLDLYLQTAGIPYVHMVKIGAEGYDPVVLEGAKGCLSTGSCPVVTFEMDVRLGKWYQRNSPTSLIQMFERFDYQCFLEGQLKLFKLPQCAVRQLKAHKATLNIICALRRSPGWHSMQPYVQS
eukprot:7309019-Pyramimonas_sp.AAC.4